MSDKKQQLMDMGFEAPRAEEALTVCDGNLERAIEYLFSGPTSDPPAGGMGTPVPPAISTAAASLSNAQDVVAPISQYSLDQGRSACTCIALTTAQEFLQKAGASSGTPQFLEFLKTPAAATVTPQFLENAIKQGVQTYQNLNNVSSGVEHMSAEEVLGLSSAGGGAFSQLQLTPGGIRQGLLTSDPSNPMGLQALLSACRQDAPSNQWLAVLITKTPETVLAILPPSNTQQYMVIDSHPRPGVVAGGGAYARILSSLNEVVLHLSTILPATELGPDIPEMMATMYNSFDLYPLVLKTK